MGNYKSRPGNSCSEEHLKKISELQTMVGQKVTADLKLLEPSQMTELQVRVPLIPLERMCHVLSQESCCRAEVERVAVFANSDSVQEVTEAGLSVAHLCVQSLGEETRHLRIVASRGATFSAKSGCVS